MGKCRRVGSGAVCSRTSTRGRPSKARRNRRAAALAATAPVAPTPPTAPDVQAPPPPLEPVVNVSGQGDAPPPIDVLVE